MPDDAPLPKVPLYRQLADTLRHRIAGGGIAPGERLPTEAELSESFGMSRITVRHALDQLVREGMIERFPSRGTFAVDRPPGGSWELRSINDLVQIGRTTATRVLGWKQVAAPPPVAAFFRSEDPVWRLRAVRLLGEVPLYYVENHLPLPLGSRIAVADLAGHTLVELLCGPLAVPVGHASEGIGIDHATPALARHLWVPERQPLILQRIEIFATDGTPLQCGDNWWRGAPFRRRFAFNRG